MSNESIDQIIDGMVDKKGRIKARDVSVLKQVLCQREDDHLDYLRQRASAHGFAPSMMQLELMRSGMGTPPTTDELNLVSAQAQIEMRNIEEAVRRFRGEGSG